MSMGGLLCVTLEHIYMSRVLDIDDVYFTLYALAALQLRLHSM